MHGLRESVPAYGAAVEMTSSSGKRKRSKLPLKQLYGTLFIGRFVLCIVRRQFARRSGAERTFRRRNRSGTLRHVGQRAHTATWVADDLAQGRQGVYRADQGAARYRLHSNDRAIKR